jgi:molybdopterin synthase sulfur carrier subunit
VLTVRFFARIRETVGESCLELPLSQESATLDNLQASLQQRGAPWRAALGESNLLRAVNRELAHGDVTLADGDEVAFYPPVTGG